MRYGYTFTNNAARTIHNAEAVGALRADREGGARARQRPPTRAASTAGPTASRAAMNAQAAAPGRALLGRPPTTPATRRSTTTPSTRRATRSTTASRPAANRAALVDDIVAQGMHQGPMTWHVLLKALADTGRYDQIVKLLTDPNADGPARILAEQGTFMWEQWNPGCNAWPCNPTNNESMSHGWGSWGIVDMVESLLGVQVTCAGRGDRADRAAGAVEQADLHRVSRLGLDAARHGRRRVAEDRRRLRARRRRAGQRERDGRDPERRGPQLRRRGRGRAAATTATRTAARCSRVGSGATHFSIGATAPGTVGGTVPATLSLTLGPAATFGAFTPGVAKGATRAQTSASVTSTAGDAALSASPARLSNGAFSLAQPVAVEPAKSVWTRAGQQ